MIKKVAIRGGHNINVPGTSRLIDEVTEDRKVYASVMKYLNMEGIEVIDVTSELNSIEADLSYGIDLANSENVDLFISIHFNNAYRDYEGAIGSECWLNPKNQISNEIGEKIRDNLVNLGFKRRENKDGTEEKHLAEILRTKMAAIIVEVCFVEATEDVKVYNNIGYDTVGLAIAQAILNKKIIYGDTKCHKENAIVIYNNLVDERAAEYLADKLNCPSIYGERAFDYSKFNKVYAVGGGAFTSYVTKEFKGIDRYDTLRKVSNFIDKM